MRLLIPASDDLHPNPGRLWKSLMRAHLGDFEPIERRFARQSME